jgi:hypothetical protein
MHVERNNMKRMNWFIVGSLALAWLAIAVEIARSPFFAQGTQMPASASTLGLPEGTVTSDHVWRGASGTRGTFDITLSAIGAGCDEPDGIYSGWCAEDNTRPNTNLMYMTSSYDPNMPLDIRTYPDQDTPLVQDSVDDVGDALPWPKLN